MMRIANKLLIVFAVSICSFFVACNDAENEQPTVKATFSEIKDLKIELLEEQEYVTGYFTLVASGKWSVSCDKMWVTFSTDAAGEFYYDAQGGAEADTVYVRVSNAARDFSESVAVVTILDATGEQTVGCITRPAQSYEFAMQASDGTVLKDIVIDGTATAWVGFATNFECGVIEYPSWLMEPVLENDGYRFNVVADSVPMEQKGILVVGNSSLTHKYSCNIEYAGMSPEAIEIEGDSPWGWIVSLDGQEFKKDQSSLSDASEQTVVYGSLSMNVVCRNYSYDFLFAEVVSETLFLKDGDEAWIKAVRSEKDKKAVTITVDEFAEKSSRAGYLFAVPDALQECFKNAVEAGKDTLVFVSGENKTDSISIYNYVLADVIQKDAGFKVVEVADDESEVEISCESDENADYYVKLSSEFTITDVMACDVELGKSYVINTKLTSDDWSKSYALHDINGEEIRATKWKLKISEGEEGYYRVSITVPKSLDEELDNNIVLRLFTSDNVNIKALVLRVQE